MSMHSITVGLLLLLLCPARLKADVLTCPPELKVEQNVMDVEEGWKASDAQPRHPFTNVMFSEGEPTQQVILAPTRRTKNKKIWRENWQFLPSSTGYWLSCMYNGTSMIISRRLSEHYRSCEVEFDIRFSSPVVKTLTCQ